MESWRKFIKEQEEVEETSPQPKAIFMAGGPGSGKSTVLKNLGLKTKIPNVINADDKYEANLEAVGLTLNGKPAAVANYKSFKDELANLDPDEDPLA